MEDTTYPQAAGTPAEPEGSQEKAAHPGTPLWLPAMSSEGGWPAPPSADVFREFAPGNPLPAQQRPIASQPPGFSQQVAPGVPGVAPWMPTTAPHERGQAPLPAWSQGEPPGGWSPPGQPRGVVQVPPSTQARNSRLLMAVLGGMAVLVILVPLVLLLVSRSSPSQPGAAQATPVQNGPRVTPTPSSPWAFTPAGTAPTSKACEDALAIPCYSPQQIQEAFGLTSLYKQGITGAGQTIVIIGAGNTTTLESDLKAFDKAWGLPDPPSFRILQPFGPPAPYTCHGGFDGLQIENTLDVEWAHAIAPGANIVLVIGANNERKHQPPPNENKCGLDYLEDDVAYALDQHLGNIISISYGGSELGGDRDTAQDKQYEQQEFDAGHAVFKRAAQEHVTVLASSGDSGATNGKDMNNPNLFWNTPNVSWPASDPYVLAVGGTTLTVQDETGTYGSERVWNDGRGGGATGGGLSVLYGEPDYQEKLQDQSLFKGRRGLPDVSFPAESNYLIYLSGLSLPGDLGQVNSKWNGWSLIGGTSASAPCWAGLIALANQMAGQPLGFIQPALYSLQGQAMHDITTGDNNFEIPVEFGPGGSVKKYETVQGYPAQPGYDLVTGWGTPIADQLLPTLIEKVRQIGNAP